MRAGLVVTDPDVRPSDDGDAIVRERLRIYEQSTRPLVEYYRGRPTFKMVDGAQPPDRVAAALGSVIDEAAAAAPSVTLFAERASRVDPGFALEATDE